MAQFWPHHHSTAQRAVVTASLLPSAEGPANPRCGSQNSYAESVRLGHVPLWPVYQLVSLSSRYLMQTPPAANTFHWIWHSN